MAGATIKRYLGETGIDREAFNARLRDGDSGAAAIFAVDAICASIEELREELNNFDSVAHSAAGQVAEAIRAMP